MQAQILLTLSVGSLKALVESGEVDLVDVPALAMREFDLRGLNVPASMFAGCSLETFDRLRDNADKAGCPVLILVEEQPLRFAFEDDDQRDATLNRIGRLATAANRLGCNSLAVCCEAPGTDEDTFELTIDGLKDAIGKIDQFDLNLLIAPNKGLTEDPDRLTDLIKRVGGFKIGSFPSFGHAETTDEPRETLRKLAPYAGGIEATITARKKGLAIDDAIDAILSVGYLNTLSINYQGRKNAIEGIRAARRSLAEALGQLDEEDLEALLAEEFPEMVEAGEGDAGDGDSGDGEDTADTGDENRGETLDAPGAGDVEDA